MTGGRRREPASRPPDAPPPWRRRRATDALEALCWIVFAISFLKGVRMPSLWAATHLTFNYGQGFVRRGLIGELLRLAGGSRMLSYNAVALVAFLLLGAAVAALTLLVWRALGANPRDARLRLAVLVFASSPALVFLVHMVGYLDYVGLVATALWLLAATRPATSERAVYYSVLPLGLVLALVHESLAIMFAPVILFTLLSRNVILEGAGEQPRVRWPRMAAALLLTGSMLGASVVVSTIGAPPARVVKVMAKETAAVADFPLRPDALEALYRPSTHIATKVMRDYYRRPGVASEVARHALIVLPGFAFLVWYGLSTVGDAGLSRSSGWLLRAALLGSAIAPLTLNLAGWDHGRWNSIAVASTLLCILASKLLLPLSPGRQPPSPLLMAAAGAVVVLGLAADHMLFDGHTVGLFPFDEKVRSLLELVRGGFRYIPSN